MPNEKQLIRALTEPTIVLDEIRAFTDEPDTPESGEQEQDGPIPYKSTKQLGGVTPLVQILSKLFSGEELSSLTINVGEGLPTCTATFLITDKSFYSRAFPKDGDIMSVFIRGKDDLFKPIRNDYIITSVSISTDEGGDETSYDSMTVFGQLNVPGYNALKCFSKKGTSMKALMQTATDLKLGFASNEVDTADEQTWICAFERTKDFIDDVSLSAYKDDNSFYKSFVDIFYYMNFVNMEPLFAEKTEIEESMMVDLISTDYGKDSKKSKEKGKLVLTNWEEHQATPFFIKKYALFNNTSSVNLKYGYKRYVHYYDALLKEPQVVFIDPKTTEGAEDTLQLLKGRAKEKFYLEQTQGNWMGVQYGENGENSHEKYLIAKTHNFQNNIHAPKMGLEVTLQALNFNIRMMQSIPIVCVIKRDSTRKMANQPADESGESANGDPNASAETPAVKAFESPIAVDKTVSGNYIVWRMSYVYENGEFRHRLTMVRREWPTPPSAGTNPPNNPSQN